jgi:hypothetical protein
MFDHLFGTSIGWLKTERPSKAEIVGSHPLLQDFLVLGFM